VQSSVQKNSGHGGPRKRILIEASKLADQNMDGIKRYVVELLCALSRLNLDNDFDLDVMVLDEVYPLTELPTELFDLELRAQDSKWLNRIGRLVPPILVRPAKFLIPAWVARRFLGKEKSDILVPATDLTVSNLPLLILPPVLVTLLQKLTPTRLEQFLRARGVFESAPRAVDPTPYDVIHLTLPNNHHHIRHNSTPLLVTVHDLSHIACPEYQTQTNSTTLKTGLDRSVAGGANFLAVSRATQEQLIYEYSIDPKRVRKVHNGCSAEHFRPIRDPETRKQACHKYCIPDAPFLLALSTIEPRKNLANTIKAFNLLVRELADSDINLVIAGANGWKSREVMRIVGGSERVYLTGYIADEDLAAIYSAARGFVYASHYEGFGLPLLEAMYCGLPVIYGNNSSMPEIVGDAGLAADSHDIHDIAHQMRRLVCEDELVESLSRRALKRAQDFLWERAAALTLAAYEELSLKDGNRGRLAKPVTSFNVIDPGY